MNKIEELSIRTGKVLMQYNMKLSVAESCTGGLIGAALTDIAGSSRYFRGGIIAYDNEIKSRLLNVPNQILTEYGAVSDKTVAAMADGACKLFKTECAISVSGIAGPDGGTEIKPVGLVYIGIAIKDSIKSFRYNFSGDRKEVRLSAVESALNRFLDVFATNASR